MVLFVQLAALTKFLLMIRFVAPPWDKGYFRELNSNCTCSCRVEFYQPEIFTDATRHRRCHRSTTTLPLSMILTYYVHRRTSRTYITNVHHERTSRTLVKQFIYDMSVKRVPVVSKWEFEWKFNDDKRCRFAQVVESTFHQTRRLIPRYSFHVLVFDISWDRSMLVRKMKRSLTRNGSL